jgi:hypothetical protein
MGAGQLVAHFRGPAEQKTRPCANWRQILTPTAQQLTTTVATVWGWQSFAMADDTGGQGFRDEGWWLH